jgi:hypothetical protein
MIVKPDGKSTVTEYITLKRNKQDVLNAFSALQNNILLILITYFTVKKIYKMDDSKITDNS